MTKLLPSTLVRHGTVPVTAFHQGTDSWPSSTFSPDQLTGLSLWLDAADYVPGTWHSKGAGPQPTIVGTPSPKVSPEPLNGLPVVRFTALEGRLRGDTPITTDYTLVYLVRLWGQTIGRAWGGQYPDASNHLVGFHVSGQDGMYDEGWIVQPGPGPLPSPWRMYGADSQAGGVVRFLVDGAVWGSRAGVAGLANKYGISGYNSVNDAETCDCEVAELVLYDRKLSDAERQQVEGYLHDKWFAPPPFAPDQIAGLELWLDAQKITAMGEGDPVNTWFDSSPARRDAVHVNTPPTYRSTAVNGKPAVEFNGGANLLNLPGLGSVLSGRTNYTVFAMYEQRGNFTQYPILMTAPSNDLWQWILEYDTSAGVYWGHGNARYKMYAADVPVGSMHLLSFHMKASDPHLYLDGTEVTTVGWQGPSGDMLPVVPNIGADVILGGYFNAQFGLDGYLGAVLVYDHALTDPERIQVETYLKGRA